MNVRDYIRLQAEGQYERAFEDGWCAAHHYFSKLLEQTPLSGGDAYHAKKAAMDSEQYVEP